MLDNSDFFAKESIAECPNCADGFLIIEEHEEPEYDYNYDCYVLKCKGKCDTCGAEHEWVELWDYRGIDLID